MHNSVSSVPCLANIHVTRLPARYAIRLDLCIIYICCRKLKRFLCLLLKQPAIQLCKHLLTRSVNGNYDGKKHLLNTQLQKKDFY